MKNARWTLPSYSTTAFIGTVGAGAYWSRTPTINSFERLTAEDPMVFVEQHPLNAMQKSCFQKTAAVVCRYERALMLFRPFSSG
ncbi:hypothetical protein T11_4510 [Trichinella zimbabwensis]|uniref:Uncharacterized protein n=1 Tax=Trichinella zimbabwensis TaxID=268475 RepID=A0A0V1GR38_9BILA|nr:hypothetical protein T11_12605 [Trichinella zimbabwensis]KRZ05545.1 hypothetical protein T11_4510 [Trichinella zimbabwensis]